MFPPELFRRRCKHKLVTKHCPDRSSYGVCSKCGERRVSDVDWDTCRRCKGSGRQPNEYSPELVLAAALEKMRVERDEARAEAEGWRDEQRRAYTAAGGEWRPAIHRLPWESEQEKPNDKETTAETPHRTLPGV